MAGTLIESTPPQRADAGPLPGRGGLRRARRRAALLRGLRHGRGDRVPAFRRGRWCTRATGRCRSPTWPATSACSSMDGLGNGRSSRCRDPRRYGAAEFARDCIAVMDATATEPAVFVAALAWRRVPAGGRAARAGEGDGRRVHRADVPLHALALVGAAAPAGAVDAFGAPLPTYRWWGRMNAVHWTQRLSGVRRVVHHAVLPRASLEQGDRGRGRVGAGHRSRDADRHRCWARITRTAARCAGSRRTCPVPVLVIHGDRDKIAPPRDGRALARLAGGRLETVHGGGHLPHARKPVQVNLALRDFCEDALRDRAHGSQTPPSWRPDGRPRALYVSSPIGLGHAQRDIAIARELRRLSPDLQIDWLAQDPVTRVLEAEGERIHPASAPPRQRVPSHRVRVRRARSALLPRAPPDGRDPGCELHALPRRRARAALRPLDRRRGVGARLLPAREPARRSARRSPGSPTSSASCRWTGATSANVSLTADYNADMVDHVAHHPEVRDLALFVGNPEDIVPERLGTGPADDPRLDRAQLRLHRLRHRLRRRRHSGSARGCAPSSATARTSRCASSPWAAPASARTCCGG